MRRCIVYSIIALMFCSVGVCEILQDQQNLSIVDELNLSRQRIEALNDSFLCDVRNVRRINLRFNSLHTVANTLNCNNSLEELDLSYNEIAYIGIKLPNLMKLDLSGNNLKMLNCTSFTGVSNLRELDLTSCGIKTIENVFLNLPELEVMILDDNRIQIINTDFFTGMPNIKSVSLRHNSISEIESSHSVDSLETLDLAYNRIEVLHEGIFSAFPNITKINLSHNRIQSIEKDALNLPSLKYLDLWFNNLNILNDSICKDAPNVKTLQLRFNNLSHIGNSLNDCHQLVKLDLSDNHIEDINLMKFAHLNSLEYLVLSRNKYTFPDEIPSSPILTSKLKLLDLSHNGLSDPDVLKHLAIFPQLEELNIGDNKFTVINDLEVIKDSFPKLTTLCRRKRTKCSILV